MRDELAAQHDEADAGAMPVSTKRVAVIGHVEWVEFFRIDHLPRAGEIIHGDQTLAVAAGGGGVAAVQLARWGKREGFESVFFTALGNDELGKRAHDELTARGVIVHAAIREAPQRRGITLVNAQRERTILVVGDRHVPATTDALPWELLASCDAVYITGCDAGTVRAARAAGALVATSRVLPMLRDAAVELDGLVGSDDDPSEVYRPGDLVPAPRLSVRTNGSHGGTWTLADGASGTYTPVPAKVTGDTYGAGDTFAAALTLALGRRMNPAEATAFAASHAVEVLAWTGPYPPQGGVAAAG